MFHADLTGASLRGAVTRNAVFYTAVARKAVFEGAHLEGADFREAELEGARFTGAWIEQARLREPSTCRRMWLGCSTRMGKFPPGRECLSKPSEKAG